MLLPWYEITNKHDDKVDKEYFQIFYLLYKNTCNSCPTTWSIEFWQIDFDEFEERLIYFSSWILSLFSIFLLGIIVIHKTKIVYEVIFLLLMGTSLLLFRALLMQATSNNSSFCSGYSDSPCNSFFGHNSEYSWRGSVGFYSNFISFGIYFFGFLIFKILHLSFKLNNCEKCKRNNENENKKLIGVTPNQRAVFQELKPIEYKKQPEKLDEKEQKKQKIKLKKFKKFLVQIYKKHQDDQNKIRDKILADKRIFQEIYFDFLFFWLNKNSKKNNENSKIIAATMITVVSYPEEKVNNIRNRIFSKKEKTWETLLEYSRQEKIYIFNFIYPDKYTVDTLLAKGGGGKVYRGTYKNLPVAIKICWDDDILKREFLFEMSLITLFSHPNIITCYGVDLTGDQLKLILPFAGIRPFFRNYSRPHMQITNFIFQCMDRCSILFTAPMCIFPGMIKRT